MRGGYLMPLNNLPVVRAGRNTRISFGRLTEVMEIPDLLEVPRTSYQRFLQQDEDKNETHSKGIRAVFEEVFPIKDFNKNFSLEFISYSLGQPKYSIDECKENGTTYAAPLKAVFRLVVNEQDEDGVARPKELREEQDVFLCEFPLMTQTGTFIINGSERVIVSQLHRSPGVIFDEETVRKVGVENRIIRGRLIPYRGSWLEFELDANRIAYVKIDRKRKFFATTLLRIFCTETAAVDDALIGKFLARDIIRENTKEVLVGRLSRIDADIFQRMKRHRIREVLIFGSGDNASLLRQFYSTEKISVDKAAEGRICVPDYSDPKTGEVVVQTTQALTPAHLAILQELKIKKVEVLIEDAKRFGGGLLPTLKLEEEKEKGRTLSRERALLQVYARLRMGDPPTMESALNFLDNMFLNPRRYDLAKVGRYKINKKLRLSDKNTSRILTEEDVAATIKRLFEIASGYLAKDDIDHLGNRRVRTAGELIEGAVRKGLARMERSVMERMSIMEIDTAMPNVLINSKPIAAAVNEFFGSSQLSQFMDQTNPLAELTHKRRLSALGPGGLNRERAGFEVRDVHYTHYGRLCPIETPEGPNIGLITSLATYSRINDFGFIETPLRKVKGRQVTDEIQYYSADETDELIISQANIGLTKSGRIANDKVLARVKGDFPLTNSKDVMAMDTSPKQLVSVAASLIPFLEHDDTSRALMGSNMQRQAVPLLVTESPDVGTGMEERVAYDSGAVIRAKRAGLVEEVTADRITIHVDPRSGGGVDSYGLVKFKRSNQDTCINQKPLVSKGQRVRVGEPIADGPSTFEGELALGKNLLVAFMPWKGYNFEDAIVISERAVREDLFSSIHIEELELDARDTKLGKEEITREIPNQSEEALRNLDEDGVIRSGADVNPGTVLVGKVTPKGETELSPEEKLLRAIFGDKAADVRDVSLKAPPGLEGKVIVVNIFKRRERDEILTERDKERLEFLEKQKNRLVRKAERQMGRGSKRVEVQYKELIHEAKGDDAARLREQRKGELEVVKQMKAHRVEEIRQEMTHEMDKIRKGHDLGPGVLKMVKVYVCNKRKLSVGDKMAGRHGNKGVVAKIVPVEDMPYLADGTPVDIVLNPLGVPSRMNVGQILESHLGVAVAKLGLKVATPVFDGATESQIKEALKEAGLNESGKTVLYDGQTGEPFDHDVTVGSMYMMKLAHLADDKIHARSIGPYSLITQQPLGGKAQFGGQRLGEMEVWALEAYGAAYTLQEMLTVKSDDVIGRNRIYAAIVKGKDSPPPGIPESFNVLIKELQGLAMSVELLTDEGKVIRP